MLPAVWRERLERVLGLRPNELGVVSSLGGLFAVLGAALAAGDVGVQSVFIHRVGPEHLPDVLLARALLSPLVAWTYAAVARPRRPRGVLAALCALAATSSAVAPSAILAGGAGVMAVYVAHELLSGLLTVHWGVYLLEHLQRDRALRGVALVYAASRGGAALAGAAVTPFVTWVGAPELMYVTAGLLVVGATVSLSRADPEPPPARVPTPEDADPEREHRLSLDDEAPHHAGRGFLRLLRESALLRALALATTAMVVARFALRYQQQSLLADLDEVALAGLLGGYTLVANLVGVALQLVVTARVLSRFGVTATNLVYPVAVAAGQAVVVATGGVGAALFARFVDSELKHAVKTPVSPLFYEAFRPAERGAARALVLGVVSPAAQVLASVTLGAAVGAELGGVVSWMGVAGAAAYVVASVLQNRGYAHAIRRGSLPPRATGGDA